MTRVDMRREVVADPASVALLLAETSPDDGGPVVKSSRRSDAGFTASVEFADDQGGTATGEVTIVPAAAGCEVRIVLAAADQWAARGVELAGWRYLDVLSSRAQRRSCAA
jgi:hypothetical protein